MRRVINAFKYNVGAASRGDHAQHERYIAKESRVTPKESRVTPKESRVTPKESRVTPGLTRGPCIVANPKEQKWIPGQARNDGCVR